MAPVRVPRILSLLAFVGLLWYVNATAPRIVPAILVLLALYAALTNTDRVQALFASASASVARGFGGAPLERKGGK